MQDFVTLLTAKYLQQDSADVATDPTATDPTEADPTTTDVTEPTYEPGVDFITLLVWAGLNAYPGYNSFYNGYQVASVLSGLTSSVYTYEIFGLVQLIAPLGYAAASELGVDRSFTIDCAVFGVTLLSSIMGIYLPLYIANSVYSSLGMPTIGFGDYFSQLSKIWQNWLFFLAFVGDIAAIVLTAIAPQPDPNAATNSEDASASNDAAATTGLYVKW